MNPCLKYPGSKQRIADWIISFFPVHHSYLEPYAGSLAVLLNKQRSRIETVNDLDDEVVNFFMVVREQPDALAKVVSLTPYARQEYNASYGDSPKEPVERARRFLIRCWQSHGFRQTHYRVGWKRDVAGREAAYTVRYWNDLPARIQETALRLKDVQIEHQDAVTLIKAFNYSKVLIYADPPYVLSTRHGKIYQHEMDDQAHVVFLEAMLQHQGPALISGYDNPLYAEALAGWHKEEISTYASHAKPATECLWMNFEPPLTFY